MPEEIEVDTQDLQDAIQELHKEREEREATERLGHWTRYVGLTTAILAVFAAIGALEAGGLANQAMIEKIEKSDIWNEYQAARQKSHVYTIGLNTILDSLPGTGANIAKPSLAGAKTPEARAKDYKAQIAKEEAKAKDLGAKAKGHDKESESLMERHERFAFAVTMIQVAIALGAVSALSKNKLIWILSLVLGAGGLGFFAMGFIHR